MKKLLFVFLFLATSLVGYCQPGDPNVDPDQLALCEPLEGCDFTENGSDANIVADFDGRVWTVTSDIPLKGTTTFQFWANLYTDEYPATISQSPGGGTGGYYTMSYCLTIYKGGTTASYTLTNPIPCDYKKFNICGGWFLVDMTEFSAYPDYQVQVGCESNGYHQNLNIHLNKTSGDWYYTPYCAPPLTVINISYAAGQYSVVTDFKVFDQLTISGGTASGWTSTSNCNGGASQTDTMPSTTINVNANGPAGGYYVNGNSPLNCSIHKMKLSNQITINGSARTTGVTFQINGNNYKVVIAKQSCSSYSN